MIYVTHDQIEAMTLADRIAIMKDGILQQLDTPHNIYNRPVNLFVAGFVGSPAMNFLKGSADGGGIKVGEVSVPTAGYQFATAPAPGAHTILGVRPEHIVVGEESREMPFSTKAEIEIVEPTGADTLAWTNVGGQSVTFRADAELDLHPGQTVEIGFDPGRGSIFSAESGARL
jgi:multiple sugar transport system ATP-binding protein